MEENLKYTGKIGNPTGLPIFLWRHAMRRISAKLYACS